MLTLSTTTAKKNVGMGQIILGRDDDALTSVLGSCIGLIMTHPAVGISVFAHIVLPASDGRSSPPGKFVDTAVPHMLDMMKEAGALRSALIVKMAGGASMFGHGGAVQIGTDNADAMRNALSDAGLELAGEDVGGVKGRRVTLNCATGELLIEVVGLRPEVL